MFSCGLESETKRGVFLFPLVLRFRGIGSCFQVRFSLFPGDPTRPSITAHHRERVTPFGLCADLYRVCDDVLSEQSLYVS